MNVFKSRIPRIARVVVLILAAVFVLAACRSSLEISEPVETPPTQPDGTGTQREQGDQQEQQQSQAQAQEQGQQQEKAQEQEETQAQEQAQARQQEQATSAQQQTDGDPEPEGEREQRQDERELTGQPDSEPGASTLQQAVRGDASDQIEDGGEEDGGEQAASRQIPQDSDERFRAAMQRFDRRLDREQFDTPQSGGAGAEAGGAGAGRQASAGANGDDEQARAGGGTPFDLPEDEEVGRQERGTRAGGGFGQHNEFPAPPDIPDGADDDIVARQLRAAAENEPDPELRARLWDEYRAYKDNQ